MLFKLKEAFRGGKNCLYIVPEQQSLSSEKRLSEVLGDCYNMGIEVLNFERLPNRIARDTATLPSVHRRRRLGLPISLLRENLSRSYAV
jgi:ATP-dependent helicase/DNAse subunit B